ncbi:MAG: PAS domain S-box protein, partial [Actinomycetota bacterium]
PGSAADVPLAMPVQWDAASVTESELAMLAADDANRLIAVSRPAAELLGWEIEELIGRRIVSIVPEGLREAHIAGFVRYLVSGESRILGKTTLVSALRRDGSEVQVLILIEVWATGGRAVFTATLTPVELTG